MSVSKKEPLHSPTSGVRQYSLNAFLDIYDTTTNVPIPVQTHKVFIEIRKDLQSVLKQTEPRNKRQERRRHQHSSNGHHSRGNNGHHHSRGNNGHHRKGSPLHICRPSRTAEDAFQTFQKKYNLILNSLIDSNADEVCHRLSRLFLQQKAVASIANGSLDEKTEQYATHVCQQLVDNASGQSIYSQVYVVLYKAFLQKVVDDGHETLYAFIKDTLVKIIMETEPVDVSKLSSKGLAKFIAYLYINNQMTESDFSTLLKTWMDAIATNEAIICEVFVHTFITLAENAIYKTKWTPYVKSMIQPLWEDGSKIGMRSRIRLWDIRDLYT
jgi:hypothetical protein